MRTDDFGREIAPLNRKSGGFFSGPRLFTIGAAIGVGICVGMGPPLPLLDKAFSAAAASEPAATKQSELPRQWLVLRNALLDPGVTGITYPEQQADEQLLRGKWLKLRDALEFSWADRIAAR